MPDDARQERPLYDRYTDGSDSEQQRLQLLCDTYDPISFSRLRRLDIEEGARCLDVGAGLATVSAFLAQLTGTTGAVLATEVVGYGARRDAPNLTHLRHRLGVDPLPAEEFDVIYSRGVLNVLVNGKRYLSELTDALKPGGQLIVETFDFNPTSLLGEAEQSYIYARMTEAARLVDVKADWGARLADDISGLGLMVLFAESTSPFVDKNHPGRLYWSLSLQLAMPFVCPNNPDSQYEDEIRSLREREGFSSLPRLTCVAAVKSSHKGV